MNKAVWRLVPSSVIASTLMALMLTASIPAAAQTAGAPPLRLPPDLISGYVQAAQALELVALQLRIEDVIGSDPAHLEAAWNAAVTRPDRRAAGRALQQSAERLFAFVAARLVANGSLSPTDRATATAGLNDARSLFAYEDGADGDRAPGLIRALEALAIADPQAPRVRLRGVPADIESWLANALPPSIPTPRRPVEAPTAPVPPPVVVRAAIPPDVPPGDVRSDNLALNKPARQSSARYPGSQGGVDGIKNGQFGFHTEGEPNAWWDVDLQQTQAISEVRVYNRRDLAERARTLQVLLSADGVNWTLVYAHNGATFGAEGQPLRIPVNGAMGRWVRLQLAESNFLHLDEVEVYGTGGAIALTPPTVPAPSMTTTPPAPSARPIDAIYIPPPVFNDPLGAMWDEQESGQTAVWTRRSGGNTFDARWSSGTRAVLDMTLVGTRVTIARRQGSDGNNCDYIGMLTGTEISGTYTCSSAPSPMPWRATVRVPR